MKRSIVLETLVFGVALLIAALGTAYAQEGHGEEENVAALRGAAVFAEFCQACHGPQGEAIGTGAAFAAIEFNAETAREIVEKGVEAGDGGATMPAYERLLEDEQVEDLMAYLETWESGEVPPLPEPNLHGVPDVVADYFGDPRTGAVIYAKFCNGCHGPEGEGRKKPDFPAFEFTSDTAQIVSASHVPAFGAAAGGPLSEAQIADLETYLASWAAEEPEEERRSEGINVLIVVLGALAIVVVGGAYLTRMVATDQA
jgi:mono/diheme cytochrome c family protein